MVRMLEESLISKAVHKNNTGLSVQKDVQTVKESDKQQTGTNSNSEKIYSKAILPISIMGAGALLIYLGTRTPNVALKIQKLYKSRIEDFTKKVIDFKTCTEDLLNKEFKKINPYIDKYRKDYWFDGLKYSADIQDSKNGFEVLNVVDSAFTETGKIRQKDFKMGVSGMDEFRSEMYNVNYYAYQSLTNLRRDISLNMLDLSLLPRYKNGEHEQLLTSLEEKLGKFRAIEDKRLFGIQNQITDEHINIASKKMARVIISTRRNMQNSTQGIMNSAFEKINKIYGLTDNVQSLSKTGKTMERFTALSPESLAPQNVSKEVSEIINNIYVKKVLENVDFNSIDDKTVKDLFESMPYSFDTKQLDMITDRLRLQNLVEKQEKNIDNPEFAHIIGKLEFLSQKLEKCGADNIIKRSEEDFAELNKEQVKAKLYHIMQAARKIGLVSLEDVDKFLINSSPTYLDTTMKQGVKTYITYPEHYFV